MKFRSFLLLLLFSCTGSAFWPFTGDADAENGINTLSLHSFQFNNSRYMYMSNGLKACIPTLRFLDFYLADDPGEQDLALSTKNRNMLSFPALLLRMESIIGLKAFLTYYQNL